MAKSKGGVRGAGAQATGGGGELARRQRIIDDVIGVARDRWENRPLTTALPDQMPVDFEGRRFYLTLRANRGRTNLVGTIDMYLRGAPAGRELFRKVLPQNRLGSRGFMLDELSRILIAAVSRGGFVIGGG